MTPDTKRYENHYLKVCLNVLRDALYAYPAMKVELGRDAERLTRLANERGLHLFMVDLPALAKHLDRCLSESQYKLSGLPASRRYSNRTPIPKLFRGLYLLVFHENGSLKENPDVEAILFLRQLYSLAKKAPFPCSSQAVDREVESFLATDGQLPDPGPWWASDIPTPPPFRGFAAEVQPVQASDGMSDGECLREGTGGSSKKLPSDQSLLARLDTIVGLVSTTLGPYRPEEWRFKHGPGVVSELAAGENRYWFNLWPERLEHVFPFADHAYYSWSSWGDEALSRTHDLWWDELAQPPVVHSRLIAVPKTLTKPRLIAAEPSAHMWCQQNIWHYFRTRVKASWLGDFVRFTDQTQNQELCRRGSVDGSLATLDLSEASDRVSCMCVGNAFRANEGLLLALRATRTRFCEISLGGSKRIVELRKYSTMGNATTFPVESLIFLAVALAATMEDAVFQPTRNAEDWYSTRWLPAVRAMQGKVSIFGDDIIVPTEKAGVVERLLTLIGFKVNNAKSFSEGNFRESCGVDAFRGIEVTPVYVGGPPDESPEAYASCIDTANNLYKRWLLYTSEFVRRQLRRGIRFPVVPVGSGAVGFQSFSRPVCPPGFLIRWNTDLQCEEFKVPVFHTKTKTTPLCDDTALLQFFTENPDPTQMWMGGLRSRPRLKIRQRWVTVTQYLAKAQESPLMITPGGGTILGPDAVYGWQK